MTTPDPDPFKALRRGLLEFAVLTVLSTGRRYAAELLEQLEGTPFATQEGTLYPLLGKLRRDGLLQHEWEESESGPPRKYHELTDEGRTRLASLDEYWQELASSLTALGVAR